MTLQDVFNTADQGKLPEKTDGQLRCMLVVCGNCQAGDLFSRTKAGKVFSMIQNELASRQAEKRHKELVLEQQRLQEKHVAESQRLHGEASKEGGTRHEQSQNVAWWTFGIATATLVVASVALIHDLWPKPIPSPKEKSLPQLSNSSAAAATPSNAAAGQLTNAEPERATNTPPSATPPKQ
jgi:hypothetical protein